MESDFPEDVAASCEWARRHLFAQLMPAEPAFLIDADSGRCLITNAEADRVAGSAGAAQLAAELTGLRDRLLARSPLALVHDCLVESPEGVRVRLTVAATAVNAQGLWMIFATGAASLGDHELLTAALDQVHDSIVVIDPETLAYLHVNEAAARRNGMSRAEMMRTGEAGILQGSRISTLPGREHLSIPDRTRLMYRELIAAHPAEMRQLQTRVDLQRRELVMETHRQAVFVHGRWLIVSVSHDVTERERAVRLQKRSMAELARSKQDLEQFAYVTSHDLSEPLRMIASYTQLLSRRYSDMLDGDGRAFMAFVVEGTQRMKMLIDDVLMYSRATRVVTDADPWPLDDVLDIALASLRPALVAKGARIEREALPVVPIHRASIVQVFQQLVDNALKFCGTPAPLIRVWASASERDWAIHVADNGIGIDERYHERIFLIFQRLHPRGRYTGNGLGLALCKKLVEAHGGSITVESTSGAGTTFIFRLPKVGL